jgi:hypothetical protein
MCLREIKQQGRSQRYAKQNNAKALTEGSPEDISSDPRQYEAS